MCNSEIKELRGRVVTTLPFSKCRLYGVDECNTSVDKWCKDKDVEKPKCFGGETFPMPLFQSACTRVHFTLLLMTKKLSMKFTEFLVHIYLFTYFCSSKMCL